ncbi:hypothetical protein [Candidatus Similichlamydia laticola]|nr:hypothetical protein [Candidatus Similichlamydia laticola]
MFSLTIAIVCLWKNCFFTSSLCPLQTLFIAACFVIGILTVFGTTVASETRTRTRQNPWIICLWAFLFVVCCGLVSIPIMSYTEDSPCANYFLLSYASLLIGLCMYAIPLLQSRRRRRALSIELEYYSEELE